MQSTAPHTDPSESTLPTADDARLHLRCWSAAGEQAARIVLVHGYGEHSGRYEDFARFLAGHGYSVQAYDQRGSGSSGGTPGRIDDFERLVDDLDAVIQHYDDGRPFFLMAHSMGATVALHWLLMRSPGTLPAGLILSSPAVTITTGLPTSIEDLALRLADAMPSLPTRPIDRNALSHDPRVKQAVDEDELAFAGRVPLGTAAAMITAGRQAVAEAHRVSLPLLLIVGTGDTIAAPLGGYAIYSRAASSDKTLAVYQGMYHETLHETNRHHVYDGILSWIDERTGSDQRRA